MRGWARCLLGLAFVLSGCQAHDCPAKKPTQTQSSAEECPDGACCLDKSRAEMLKQSQQTTQNVEPQTSNHPK